MFVQIHGVRSCGIIQRGGTQSVPSAVADGCEASFSDYYEALVAVEQPTKLRTHPLPRTVLTVYHGVE